jgi:hypothetical protein
VEKKVRGKKYEKKSAKKKVWGKKVREKSRRKSTGKRYGQACAMVRSPSSTPLKFNRWENVRLDLYIFEYLFINKIFEMKNISLNDIYFF